MIHQGKEVKNMVVSAKKLEPIEPTGWFWWVISLALVVCVAGDCWNVWDCNFNGYDPADLVCAPD